MPSERYFAMHETPYYISKTISIFKNNDVKLKYKRTFNFLSINKVPHFDILPFFVQVFL